MPRTSTLTETDKKLASELLERAKSGEILSDKERRFAIEYLLIGQGQLASFSELAELFRVDVSQITRDLNGIIKDWAAAQNISPVKAEISFWAMAHIAAIDSYLSANLERLKPSEFAMLLRERRETLQGAWDRLRALEGWE